MISFRHKGSSTETDSFGTCLSEYDEKEVSVIKVLGRRDIGPEYYEAVEPMIYVEFANGIRTHAFLNEIVVS